MFNEKIIKEAINKTIEHFKIDISSLRTGRASPALVENLAVDYYGVKTPLIQLASINIPEPKQIVIQPWDKNSLKEIEKAINTSDLGLNPINEGNIIRLVIPPLTEERRNDLVKILHQKEEETKIATRNIREEEMKKLKSDKNEGKISEDQYFIDQKKLQEIIDEYHRNIEMVSKEKEKELLTI